MTCPVWYWDGLVTCPVWYWDGLGPSEQRSAGFCCWSAVAFSQSPSAPCSVGVSGWCEHTSCLTPVLLLVLCVTNGVRYKCGTTGQNTTVLLGAAPVICSPARMRRCPGFHLRASSSGVFTGWRRAGKTQPSQTIQSKRFANEADELVFLFPVLFTSGENREKREKLPVRSARVNC